MNVPAPISDWELDIDQRLLSDSIQESTRNAKTPFRLDFPSLSSATVFRGTPLSSNSMQRAVFLAFVGMSSTRVTRGIRIGRDGKSQTMIRPTLRRIVGFVRHNQSVLMCEVGRGRGKRVPGYMGSSYTPYTSIDTCDGLVSSV